MSITSEELNYLIWRYLQETGNEVSALALQDETRVLDFDTKYGEDIPLGALVELVQKGILYTECDLLVDSDGKVKPVGNTHYSRNFNLAEALQVEKEKGPDRLNSTGFALEHEPSGSLGKDGSEDHQKVSETEKHAEGDGNSGDFISTLKELHKLGKIVTSCWNPVSRSTLAIGEKSSQASILQFEDNSTTIKNKYELKHPFAPDVTNGKATNEVTCLSWSPNGEEIVSGVENGELRLWTSEGKLKNVLNFHRSPIICIKWSKDSLHFITADVENVTIVWNAVTGTALQHFEIKAQETSTDSLGVDLEWVEHDKFIIPGLQGSLVVHQMGESKAIGRLIGHQGPIIVLKFNPSNKLLLSASDDHTLRVWRGGSSNSCNCFLGHSQSIVSAEWIDDDKVISASMDGTIRLWSVADNSLQALSMTDGVPVFCGKLSKDKTKYAVGLMDGQITVYDVQSVPRDSILKKAVASIVSLPIHGTFQSPIEGDSIFDLSWCYDNYKVAAAYSKGDGAIISI